MTLPEVGSFTGSDIISSVIGSRNSSGGYKTKQHVVFNSTERLLHLHYRKLLAHWLAEFDSVSLSLPALLTLSSDGS